MLIDLRYRAHTNKVLASVHASLHSVFGWKGIMSRTLKSFADFSLKLVAVRTADNSDFEFEYPAAGLQSKPSALTTPLEQHLDRPRDPLAEFPAWQHGGINE